jgi:hypothetical protein
MKKLLVLLIAVTLITGFTAKVSAQEKDFEDGTNIIHAGLGLGMAGMYYDTSIPPLTVSFDRGIFINEIPLSFGLIAGIAQSTYSQTVGTEEFNYKYTYFIFGVRGAYHFDFGIEKFDPYAGITIGYNIVKFSADFPAGYEAIAELIEDEAISFFLWGFEIGGTYYFTPKLGAYLELGYGVAMIRLGVALKF